MTRQDFLIKWGVYALALVPVWFLELFVLNRFPLFGVAPMLLPLAAVCVAVLEGTTAGAGFGLFVGILCDAAYFNTDGAMTVGLCLIGVGAGALAQYVLRQNLVGCLLCSFAALALIDGVRIAARLLAGRIEVLFRSTVHPVKCKKHSRITQRTLLVCFLSARCEAKSDKV